MPRRGTRFHKKGDGGNNFVRMRVNPLLSDPDSVMSLKRVESVWTRKGRCSTLILGMTLSEPSVRGYALVGRAVIFSTPSATKHSTVTGKMIQFSISQPQAL